MHLLYKEIAERIEKRISDGVYGISAKIPGEQNLAEEFKVSRPTIKKAVELLEGKGLIRCHPSIGSFVKKSPVSQKLFAYISPNLSDPFHAEFTRVLNQRLVADGHSLLVDDNSHTSVPEIIARLEERNVDGIIFCPSSVDQSFVLGRCKIPVLWMASVPENEALDYLDIANEEGISSIVAHLQSSGVKTSGYVRGGHYATPDPRKKFFLEKAALSGLEVRDEWCISLKKEGVEGGREIAQRLLKLPQLPDAVVCHDDWNAFGVIEEFVNAGVRIPQDLRVTGFDNLPFSGFYRIPLTTVDCQIGKMSLLAYEMLSARIKNKQMRRQVQISDCELVIRES